MRFKLLAGNAAIGLLAVGVAAVDASRVSGKPYLGTWTARLSQEQLITAGRDVRLAGRFRLVLRSNGTYTTSNSFDGASRGKFRVSGRRLVFFDDIGCQMGGLFGEGVYTWSIRNGKLRIKGVSPSSDPCGGRRATLEYPVWTRR